MLKALQKLFGGDSNDRDLKKIWPTVDEINEIAERLQHVTDTELQAKTADFRDRIAQASDPIEAEQAEISARLQAAGGDDADADPTTGSTISVRERQDLYQKLDDLEGDWLDAVEDVLDDIMAEAFAVVKETCRRFVGKSWVAGGSEVTWEMVPFDVQLLGGVVLHRGQVAEMKTGEGKTLTSVAPIYLNALVGRGVHVVTVNPYLAQRDAEWMAPIFEFHGLTVDCIDKHPSHSPGRRGAYRADITYGTNNEFGFDYLRDNSFVVDANQLVQRHHHYAIVDEVDSVLIDEARTPLIISGPVPQASVDEFGEFQPPIERMVRDQQKLVAGYVSDAERKLLEADNLEANGDKKQANRLRDEAGLALLRAQRGFPRNKKLIKIKGEPGVEVLIRRVEAIYLAESAKRMPEVDEPLYFALEEAQHQIEMTDKGRDAIGRSAGTDAEFFVIPDVGNEIAVIERDYNEKKADLIEVLKSDTSLDEEKRQNKLDNDLRVLRNEAEEAKRLLYTNYAEKSERIHAVNQLLRGYTLYEKDKEYIVQDDKVMIVDEHTGRVLPGRRYSDGLHQAIEAKEKVKVQAATQTYATITIQNYFRMYAKLAGMTGTAETESEEFGKIYDLPVVVVPTNRPIARADDDDLIYKTKRAKYKALVNRVEEIHETGQPLLIGSASVETSEQMSRLLQRAGIKHNVLNAKASRAQSEAQIVAEAGQKGAVTIATNMAGRGTDIKLGEGVKDLGGLAILGTERHDSRRIDLQLRGRAGRQGDPGFSQFYVSLEDDLMRLFGHDRTAKIMDRLGMEEDEVLTHKWLTKGVERSQTKVEQNHFASRKRQLEYDDVLNAQREVIYDRRMHALEGDRLRGDILDMLRGLVERIVQEHYGNGDIEEIRESLIRHLAFDLEVDPLTASNLGEDGMIEKILDEATSHYRRKRAALAAPFYTSASEMMANAEEDKRPKKLFVDFTDGRKVLRATVTPEAVLESQGQEINDSLERSAVLSVIDEKWTEHLRDLDEVKQGVGLRSYGQKDPLIEYKMEAFKLFKELVQTVDEDVIGLVFKAGPLVQGDSQRQAARRVQQVSKPRLDASRAQATQEKATPDYKAGVGGDGASSADRDPTAKSAPVVVEKTVGRNEPCPCGSGKKYKHCHGRG